MGVTARFETFLSNITLTDAQRTAGGERREAVIGPLNRHYYASSSKTSNSVFIGSWAKRTRIRPPRDVDVLFALPKEVYDRYQGRTGNRQSQSVVPFSAYNVELIPAFKLTDGKYWICITTDGGSYKTADYDAEANQISTSNTNTNGNTRDLVKMMKCWQGYCSVPIKSFWLELLSVEFLNPWENRGKSKTYYDWMVRDFLKYLYGRRNSYVYAPGTGEMMYLGEVWASRASTARPRGKSVQFGRQIPP